MLIGNEVLFISHVGDSCVVLMPIPISVYELNLFFHIRILIRQKISSTFGIRQKNPLFLFIFG